MWFGTRSRPDILAAMSIGASVVQRRPADISKFAWDCGDMCGTLDECLLYGPNGNPAEMTSLSDASFAPEGSQVESSARLAVRSLTF